MMKKVAFPIQILIGLVAGLIFALLSIQLGWPADFTINYIKPWGTIFLNSLKMIAIPLIFASLIIGIANIEDVTKLSRIGGRTLLIYTTTTVLAVILGLTVANLAQPGKIISEHTRNRLMEMYGDQAVQHGIALQQAQLRRPLQFLVDLVPENLAAALSDNTSLLQVVVVSIILGIALLKIPPRQSKPVIRFFDGINGVTIELVQFSMKLAPLGVFALVASLLTEVAGNAPDKISEILFALLGYMATVILGLLLLTYAIYPLILKLFTKVGYVHFFRNIQPAQLIAFTTSSSSAALPVTMDQVKKHLGVSEEISNFVLPLGATINMDGTALYQGIAVVFIAQALGIDLSISVQLIIVANVAISSIGVAGVPGASIITTTMILQSIGIPAAGLALILVPDRILDMCRTATNITGDAVVAVLISSLEGEITKVNDKRLCPTD
jgi:Na+/H+-dicarboxylate symporter